jgi:hypothetical protein
MTILVREENHVGSIGRYLYPIDIWLALGSAQEYRLKVLPPGETVPVTLTIPGITYEDMSSGTNDPSPSLCVMRLCLEKIGADPDHFMRTLLPSSVHWYGLFMTR